jgi:vacuolar-type H+-ATPase subunit F/Vma7
LNYIIDENPLKIGLYSPKMNIPIVDINHFMNDTSEDKYMIIILAWNFSKEIKEKIRKYKGNKKCVILETYFPEIVIHKLI